MYLPPRSRPIRSYGCALSLQCLLVIFLPMAQPAFAAPIDEFRISDIEQKIRDLESTTREQARQIAQLQTRVGGSLSANPPAATDNSPTTGDQRWLIAANWARLKLEMSELQIIDLLGVPTQIRTSDDGQTRSLLYAMEIGRSGFLSGKVDLQDNKVSSIEPPRLR
jgi:hypothetical protein